MYVCRYVQYVLRKYDSLTTNGHTVTFLPLSMYICIYLVCMYKCMNVYVCMYIYVLYVCMHLCSMYAYVRC